MLTQDQLLQAIPHALQGVDLPNWTHKLRGKVRDIYAQDDQRILITTDRVSAFDRVLGYIPYRGQVLNQLSAWWFEQTRDIVRNHLINVPDPNVTIAHDAEALPVEVVVRGYITGVTSTSIWTLYEQGEREPYGVKLPDGLHKNDPLPQPMITPTTKAQDGGHDERITRDEIIARGLINADLWAQIEAVALKLFARGQIAARRAGLILVDTKYEFGLIDGELALIDEIHTPDSSRYWTQVSYDADTTAPEHYDKEFLRLWFKARGYSGDGPAPTMPPEFIAQVAQRYIAAYEYLTQHTFAPAAYPADERIINVLSQGISKTE